MNLRGLKMKFYHVKTQEAYDALMLELEGLGYRWFSGARPTESNFWSDCLKDTYIKVDGKFLTYGNVKATYKDLYSDYPLIEYKAAERESKEPVAQEIADEIISFKKNRYTNYQVLVVQIEEILEDAGFSVDV